MTHEARRALQRQLEDVLDCRPYLTKAKRSGYICPRCHSGEHSTGALSYYKDTHRCYCHACGQRVSIFDLYMYRTGCTFPQAFKELAEMNGYDVGESKPLLSSIDTSKFATGTKEPSDKNLPQHDFLSYYRLCTSRLSDPQAVSYLSSRGISLETAKKAFVGFDPRSDPITAPGGGEGKYHFGRLIFPCSRGFYTTRRTEDTGKKSDKLNVHGTVCPFHLSSLKTGEPVVVVEGAFDCLSILECGYHAVALCGAGQWKKFAERPEVKSFKGCFILCPDFEQDPKKKAIVEGHFLNLLVALQGMGKESVVNYVSSPYKDVNLALTRDKLMLENRLKNVL